MLCLNMDAGKTDNIRSIPRVASILRSSARVRIAIFAESAGELTLKAFAFFSAIYFLCHAYSSVISENSTEILYAESPRNFMREMAISGALPVN